MIILQGEKTSESVDCSYLSGRVSRFDYFFATKLDEYELGHLLSTGWRKFGYYFFKPNCPNCKKCSPLRVKVKDFKPTKSQRRIINKNRETHVEFRSLKYSEKIFEIYKNHSLNRFGRNENSKEEFISSFFTESCPTFQSMYYIGNKLAGVGFIDRTQNGLSSVYYIFSSEYNNFNLGTFSIVREIKYAEELGLDYYYLGYYIKESKRMEYKGRFLPYEVYDWDKRDWEGIKST